MARERRLHCHSVGPALQSDLTRAGLGVSSHASPSVRRAEGVEPLDVAPMPCVDHGLQVTDHQQGPQRPYRLVLGPSTRSAPYDGARSRGHTLCSDSRHGCASGTIRPSTHPIGHPPRPLALLEVADGGIAKHQPHVPVARVPAKRSDIWASSSLCIGSPLARAWPASRDQPPAPGPTTDGDGLQTLGPQTAPRPVRPAARPWSLISAAIFTRCSPASPMQTTLALESPSRAWISVSST